MTKQINLHDRTPNGDGTDTLEAELSIYEDNGDLHIGMRSRMVFLSSLTDQEIIDYLIEGDFKIYKDY